MKPVTKLEDLQRDPTKWHRRGLYHPDELEQIVRSHLKHTPAGVTYADFFTQDPAAP